MVEPAPGPDLCHVLPEVSTAAMTLLLSRFSAGLAADERAVMMLDGAGWHTSLDNAVLQTGTSRSSGCHPARRS